jgi:glutathione peroxidase-family protein
VSSVQECLDYYPLLDTLSNQTNYEWVINAFKSVIMLITNKAVSIRFVQQYLDLQIFDEFYGHHGYQFKGYLKDQSPNVQWSIALR